MAYRYCDLNKCCTIGDTIATETHIYTYLNHLGHIRGKFASLLQQQEQQLMLTLRRNVMSIDQLLENFFNVKKTVKLLINVKHHR